MKTASKAAANLRSRSRTMSRKRRWAYITSVTGPDEFNSKIIGALRRLQKLPHVVRAFFADPDLRYITA